MFDIIALRAQIDEHLILEDEMELAQLAILVPDLIQAMLELDNRTNSANDVLFRAQRMIEEFGESGYPFMPETL